MTWSKPTLARPSVSAVQIDWLQSRPSIFCARVINCIFTPPFRGDRWLRAVRLGSFCPRADPAHRLRFVIGAPDISVPNTFRGISPGGVAGKTLATGFRPLAPPARRKPRGHGGIAGG